MYRRGIEQVREVKSSRKKKDKTVSFFKKWFRKIFSSSQQSNKTKPNAELVFVNREQLLYLEFNKPNKENISEINSFSLINSTFLSLKRIVDLLTDVANAKQQNIPSL